MSVWTNVIDVFNSDPLKSVSNTITKIFHFISPDFQEDNSFKTLIIFAAITGIELLVLIFQIVYFHVRNQYVSWTLYITRFVLEIFSLLIIGPLSYNIGDITSHIFEKGVEKGSILALVFFLFFFIINTFFLYFYFFAQMQAHICLNLILEIGIQMYF
jgi:hypothetical protein